MPVCYYHGIWLLLYSTIVWMSAFRVSSSCFLLWSCVYKQRTHVQAVTPGPLLHWDNGHCLNEWRPYNVSNFEVTANFRTEVVDSSSLQLITPAGLKLLDFRQISRISTFSPFRFYWASNQRTRCWCLGYLWAAESVHQTVGPPKPQPQPQQQPRAMQRAVLQRGCVGRQLANRNEMRVSGSDSYELLFFFSKVLPHLSSVSDCGGTDRSSFV